MTDGALMRTPGVGQEPHGAKGRSGDDRGRGTVSAVRDQLQTRLAELKREYQLGEGQLGELTRRETALRETLLRIAGAIQVLEELLAGAAGEAPVPADPPDRGAADENGNRSQPDVLTVP
jgi:hypothetical protein